MIAFLCSPADCVPLHFIVLCVCLSPVCRDNWRIKVYIELVTKVAISRHPSQTRTHQEMR